MNRYELLKNNENLIFQFVKNGILSYMMIRDIEIIENFIQLEDVPKEMRYIMLAEQYELSTDRIKQIIYNMNSKIK
jgi:DNA polymerase III delta prime subunit